jgi:hypothetical protein
VVVFFQKIFVQGQILLLLNGFSCREPLPLKEYLVDVGFFEGGHFCMIGGSKQDPPLG